MTTMTFAASKENVVVWRDGVPFAVLHWHFALELGRAYQDVGEKATRGQCIEHRVSYKEEQRTVQAHITDHDEIRVLALSRGIVVADLEPTHSLEIGNAMIAKARLAEEHVKYERVIADQALMMRTGGQVSLSGNPDINNEAWKTAETDRTLIKNIPSPTSIPSKETFGYPMVKKQAPQTTEEQIADMTDAERAAVRRLLLN